MVLGFCLSREMLPSSEFCKVNEYTLMLQHSTTFTQPFRQLSIHLKSYEGNQMILVYRHLKPWQFVVDVWEEFWWTPRRCRFVASIGWRTIMHHEQMISAANFMKLRICRDQLLHGVQRIVSWTGARTESNSIARACDRLAVSSDIFGWASTDLKCQSPAHSCFLLPSYCFGKTLKLKNIQSEEHMQARLFREK